METAKASRRRISLSGMLKKLGVSRSGYQAFLTRGPSESQIRKERVMQRILEITSKYDAQLTQKKGKELENIMAVYHNRGGNFGEQ